MHCKHLMIVCCILNPRRETWIAILPVIKEFMAIEDRTMYVLDIIIKYMYMPSKCVSHPERCVNVNP